MHFPIKFPQKAKKKKKRKWQQETGILRGRRPRRSLLHQTISIGFVSEPNSCFELGRLKQLVSFQIFLHKKRERNRDVRMTRYYSHKTVRINPSASRSSSNRRKALSPFLTCLQHVLGKKKSALSTCPESGGHCCAQAPRIEPLTELHPSLTPQGVRMERGSRVNVSKNRPRPPSALSRFGLSVSRPPTTPKRIRSANHRRLVSKVRAEVSLFPFGNPGNKNAVSSPVAPPPPPLD